MAEHIELNLGDCVRLTPAYVVGFCLRTGLNWHIRMTLLKGTLMRVNDDGFIPVYFIEWDDGEIGFHGPGEIEYCHE